MRYLGPHDHMTRSEIARASVQDTPGPSTAIHSREVGAKASGLRGTPTSHAFQHSFCGHGPEGVCGIMLAVEHRDIVVRDAYHSRDCRGLRRGCLVGDYTTSPQRCAAATAAAAGIISTWRAGVPAPPFSISEPERADGVVVGLAAPPADVCPPDCRNVDAAAPGPRPPTSSLGEGGVPRRARVPADRLLARAPYPLSPRGRRSGRRQHGARIVASRCHACRRRTLERRLHRGASSRRIHFCIGDSGSTFELPQLGHRPAASRAPLVLSTMESRAFRYRSPLPGASARDGRPRPPLAPFRRAPARALRVICTGPARRRLGWLQSARVGRHRNDLRGRRRRALARAVVVGFWTAVSEPALEEQIATQEIDDAPLQSVLAGSPRRIECKTFLPLTFRDGRVAPSEPNRDAAPRPSRRSFDSSSLRRGRYRRRRREASRRKNARCSTTPRSVLLDQLEAS